MNRDVDVAGQERRIEFLGEQPLPARFGQRTILDRIACRADLQDGDRRLRPFVGRREPTARLVSLGQRQGASPGSQSQRDRLARHAVSLLGLTFTHYRERRGDAEAMPASSPRRLVARGRVR